MKIVTTEFMEFLEESVQGRTAQMKWMENRTFKRAENVEEVMLFIDKAINAGKCVVDLETTGLNSRVKKVAGAEYFTPVEKIVGFGLCYDTSFGLYIPINHKEDSEFNLPEDIILKEIKRLCANCITIYHNAKFDHSFLANHGIRIDSHKMFDDTQLMAYLYDSGNKDNKLKHLSPRLIDQPMLEFEEVAKNGRFDLVSPKIGYIYGASDAICTLDLYNFFLKQDIFKAQQLIYNLEKRVVFAVMKMESNLVKIDIPYLEKLKIKTEARIKEIEEEIHTLAGHEFNIASTQQLGKVLFDELRYKYPETHKTASGQYMTDSATFEKIADVYPIVKKIIEYRVLMKYSNTYIKNLLNNSDEDGCVKLSFKQTGTDTGRFSSPGGQGLHEDGLSGVNVQSIPKEPDENNPDIDLRKTFIARQGKTIVAVDYENEEMRIATNLSKETAWIGAIKEGVDFHTATACIITGKSAEDITKIERKRAKTVNFLALYLGGPRALAVQAKVTVAEAKKILVTFFAGVPKLKKWIDREIVKARKLKYVKTAFGRIRPLTRFYGSGDRGLEAHGDRCAVNTQVQGAAADIMKAVMAKLNSWIHRNSLQEDIKILITMHDELVFEITTEKLDLYVPEIAKIMMLKEVITDQLNWDIPLTVDIKYGNSWRVKDSFFKDFPEAKEKLNEPLFELDIPQPDKKPVDDKPLVEKVSEPQSVESEPQDIVVENKEESLTQKEVFSEPQSIESEAQDVVSQSKESNQYIIYTLRDRRKITLRWLNDILNFLLEEADKYGDDSKKILKIRDQEGNSLLVSEYKIHVESFLLLASFLGI